MFVHILHYKYPHPLCLPKCQKRIQKHLMKHVIMHSSGGHEQTCTGTTNIIPGLIFPALLAYSKLWITFLKMKIFIQQQHRFNDFIKRVTPLKNVQSDSNCTRRTPPITTSYTDNSGRHKQTPYSLHKAAVQSVFYLNCKRWQRKKLVFSSTRSSSVAPYVWSFCGTPWPFRVDTTTVWSALRATGSRRTRRSCAAVQSADRPSPRDLRSTKTHCLRKLLRNWDRLECVPPPSLELRIKSMPKKSRTSSCSVRCVWLLFWL